MASRKLGSVKNTDVVLITSVDLVVDVGGTVLPVANGGSGTGTYTNGQILIGQTTGNTLAKKTLSGAVSMDEEGVVTLLESNPGLGIIVLQNQQTSGVNSGEFTNGADRTRVLNVEVTDTGNDCALAANQFVLTAGTYEIVAVCPAVNCGRHQAWLHNATEDEPIAECIGTAMYITQDGTEEENISMIVGRFTVAADQDLEIRHRCQYTQGTYGFGLAGSFATPNIEIYTTVFLRRVA